MEINVKAFLYLCSFYIWHNQIALSEENIDCAPRKTMISTSKNGEFHIPQYIWTNRCSGITPFTDPHEYVCVPKEVQNMEKELSNSWGEISQFSYEEHTACKVEKCSEKALNCKPGTYDPMSCSCKSDCNSKVSENKGSGNGLTKGTVTLTTLVVAMIAELGFILLIACLIITKCKCRRQVHGVIHKTTQSISRHLPSIAIGGRPMSMSTPYKRNNGSVSLLEDDPFTN